MQIVLDTSTVAAALGAFGGAAATAGASYTLVIRPLRTMMTKMRLLLEDWYGEAARPGVRARPGVMERLASIDDQMKTNGGGSLRDAVTRIEARVNTQLTTAPPNYPPPAA